MDAEDPDLGRVVVSKDGKDTGAFKTPTLRNIALTAPYMHDGSQATLEVVVDFYAKGGHPNDYLHERIKKIDLTDQEKADLVAFMRDGLTGELPDIPKPRLP
jgi:cytochrome c peroxidase